MGEVHELIARHGKQAALLAELDRQAVEVAAAYMADEEVGALGFSTAAGARQPCPIENYRTVKAGR
jgi:hypothetical protein